MIENKVHQTIVVSVVLFYSVTGESTKEIFFEDSQANGDTATGMTTPKPESLNAPVTDYGRSHEADPVHVGNSTKRPRRRPSYKKVTTLSTRAYITFTGTFKPSSDFCIELMPIYYHEVLPGDPPCVVEMEWATPEVMTVSIVGSPYTRSRGFLMQARIKNTIIPVGTFPKTLHVRLYDCPPGKLNTVMKQEAKSRYLHTIDWYRPQNISIENITFVVSVLKPFDLYYQKTFDLPPLPERFVSAEITVPKVKRNRNSTGKVNRTKRITNHEKRQMAMFKGFGLNYVPGADMFG